MGRILGTDPAIPLDQFLQAGKFLQGVPCHRKERTGYFLPKPAFGGWTTFFVEQFTVTFFEVADEAVTILSGQEQENESSDLRCWYRSAVVRRATQEPVQVVRFEGVVADGIAAAVEL